MLQGFPNKRGMTIPHFLELGVTLAHMMRKNLPSSNAPRLEQTDLGGGGGVLYMDWWEMLTFESHIEF